MSVMILTGGMLTLGAGSALAGTPPTIDHEVVSNVKAHEATLEGAVNPNGELTECHFQYGDGLVVENEVACTPELLKGSSEQSVGPLKFENGGFVPAPITGLEAGKTYKYRIIVVNGKGEVVEGEEETFTTKFSPVTPETGKPSEPVPAMTATLHGVLNPSEAPAEAGSYEFLYRQSATECRYVLTPAEEKRLEEEIHNYELRKEPEEAKKTESELNKDREEVKENKATAGTVTDGKKAPVQAAVSGLLPGTTYTFCLLARNEVAEEALGAPVTFTTEPEAPKVTEAFSTGVSSDSATLHAMVDPGGAETSYRFEYARAGEGFKPVSEPKGSGTLPAGAAGVPVEVLQAGLEPSTAYEFRVVAKNEVSEKEGRPAESEAVSFTTQAPPGEFVLPDNRAYEMVSPPQKRGANITHPLRGSVFESAAGGEAFTYAVRTPTEPAPAGYVEEVQLLSTRGASGWQTRDLTLPHELTTSDTSTKGQEYRFFSSDLSGAIVQPFGPFTPCVSPGGGAQPCLSPAASEQTTFLDDLQTGTYTPLVTGCPAAGQRCAQAVQEHANVPPGTEFGGDQEGGHNRECAVINEYCGPYFIAATPDLSHVVLESEVGLTGGEGSQGGLYEWSGGKLTFVGHDENEGYVEEQGAYVAHGAHGISEDGSRVIFRGESEGKSGLLLRDTATEETVKLNEKPGEPLPESEPQAESADDSRVFFDTGWETTDEELEVWEQTSGPGEPLAGKATDLSEGQGMLGLVLGASEDGSYVYFVSEGVLAGTSGAVAGKDNLYVDHYDGSWTPTFITSLSSEDGTDWYAGSSPGVGWQGAKLSHQPARVSPNGRYLAFMSQAQLTGYDNIDASEQPTEREEKLQHVSANTKVKRRDAEVYEYDAETNRLTCASCDPTGARPTGVEYETAYEEEGAETFRTWPERSFVAADLPGWYQSEYEFKKEGYQPRYLSDSGRLFFNSGDALVPQDVDGTWDVYEYEPVGVGSCSSGTNTGSSTYEPARRHEVDGRTGESGAGCVGLISSGNSSQDSLFLDASEGDGPGEHGGVDGDPNQEAGADVFFMTTAKLAPQDQDSAYDVYDAHECTSESPCTGPRVAPPPCDTEASCKASPTPQPSIYGLPASATFNGPGNFAPPPPAPTVVKPKPKPVKCKKGYTKNKHNKCIKKKKKHKAKRASYDRRAGR